jgi:hypothetical protein
MADKIILGINQRKLKRMIRPYQLALSVLAVGLLFIFFVTLEFWIYTNK